MKCKKDEPLHISEVSGIDIKDLNQALSMILSLMLIELNDYNSKVAGENIYDVETMISKYGNNCPVELSLAFMAWAATVRLNPQNPKREIKCWLKEHSQLSHEAVERIAIVANWDKKAGRRKSN